MLRCCANATFPAKSLIYAQHAPKACCSFAQDPFTAQHTTHVSPQAQAGETFVAEPFAPQATAGEKLLIIGGIFLRRRLESYTGDTRRLLSPQYVLCSFTTVPVILGRTYEYVIRFGAL